MKNKIKLREIRDKYLSGNFFNKLILLYASITICVLMIFSYIVSKNVTIVLQEKQIYYNNLVLNSVRSHFLKKSDTTFRVVQKIYDNMDLSQSIFDILENPDSDFHDDPFKKKKVVDLLKIISRIDDDIEGIAIYKNLTGDIYLYSKDSSELRYQNIVTPQLSQLAETVGVMKVIPTYNRKPATGTTDKVFGIIYNLVSPTKYNSVGKVMVELDVEGIKRAYSEYADNLKGYILILADDGHVIFDSSERYYFRKYPYFSSLGDSNISMKLEEESLVTIKRLDNSNIIFVGVTPKSQITNIAVAIKKMIYFISFLSIVFAVLLYCISVRGFSERIKNIINAMTEVKDGNLRIRLPIYRQKDEITQIATNFNKMCDDLEKYINIVYISEIKQKNAELATLQSKINPHFMYNTLEAIRMHAMKEESQEVGDMIYMLALLFRNLFRKGMAVDIEDEIDACSIYMNIFKIRYGEIFKVDYDIAPEVYDYGIIKNTLLPIIENYFIHGFKPKSNDNHLIIGAYKRDKDIYINIIDNGIGMTQEKLEAVKNNLTRSNVDDMDSIGLTNVNDRLKNIYGRCYGIDISSTAGLGTNVVVKVKAKTKKQLEDIMHKHP